MRKSLVSLFAFVVVLFLIGTANAQIAITVTNPTNTTPPLLPVYPSLATAVTALNSVTAMTGPVTFTMTAGGSETAPATGIVIGSASLNAVLSATNNVTFVKSGGTVTLNAGVGTSTPGSAVPDGILALVGADWITIDGLTLTDANITNPASMEFGIGIFKASLSDGAQNNTIQNCVFNMQSVNNAAGTAPMFDGSVAIEMVNATNAAATTPLVPTTAAGANNNNKFYSNVINGGNIGIGISGYAAPSPYTTGDTGNDIGGTSAATGNSILNFGGAPAAANPSAGIRVNNVWSTNISRNTINNNNGAGSNHVTTLRGIYGQAGTSANIDINFNTITIHGGGTTAQVSAIENVVGSTAAGNTVNINNNFVGGDYLTATTGNYYVIYNQSSPATLVMKSNNVTNLSYSALALTGTGTVYPIYNSGAPTIVTMRLNFVNNISRTGSTGGSTTGIYCSGGTTEIVTSNTVQGITIDGTGASSTITGIQTAGTTVVCDTNTVGSLSCIKSTGTSTLYGIYNISSPTNENYNYNNISGLTHNGTGTTYGIYTFTTTGVRTVSNNNVNTIYTNGTLVAGINQSSSSPTIFKNKVTNIQSGIVGGAPTVSGITITSVGTSGVATIYNNIVGDIKAPNASTVSAITPSVRGIQITSTTATSSVNIYNNSVYLNATTTGTNLGTTCLWATISATATTAALTIRNNAFVNNSTPAGLGLSVAYQRSAVGLLNYTNASNTNLFYAGTPSAANLLFYDGTNSIQTMTALKTLVTPREANSMTENPTFKSLVSSNANYLKVDSTVATQMEGSGQTISSPAITNDYFNIARYPNAGYPVNPSYPPTGPDIGANEFGGIAVDVGPPIITYTAFGATNSTGNRVLTATLTDVSGVNTSASFRPRIYYKKNGGSYFSSQGSLSSGTALNGVWNFTIVASDMGGLAVSDVVSYFVIAQDVAGAPGPYVGSNPAAGLVASDVNTVTTPPTTPNSYQIVGLPLSGTLTVGTTLFNRVTGKNIYFEERTRTVTKQVPVYEEAVIQKTSKEPVTSGMNAPQGKQIGTESVTSTEKYSVMMENGHEYSGPNYHELTSEERSNNGLSPDMSGIYLTITAAANDANLRGVNGNTTFSLTDATYPTETFPITFTDASSNPPNSSATIKVKPALGVSPSISGVSNTNVIFKITDNYTTIDGSNTVGGSTRDMTISNTSVTSPSVVLIGSNGSTYVDHSGIMNCILINGINTSTALVVSDAAALGTAGYFSNITIQNNSIQKAYIGMYLIGNVASTSFASIIGNDMNTVGANAIRFTGVYLQQVNGALVSRTNCQSFSNTEAEDDQGIWAATGVTNTVIERNYVGTLNYTGTSGYGAHGVQMSTGTLACNNTIQSNQFANLSGDGWVNTILGDNTHGIYLFTTQTGIKVYNNSINFNGNTLNQTGAMSYGITLGTGSTADVRNNIIVNNLGLLGATGLGTTCVWCQTDNTQLVASDNNDYYCNATGTGVKDIGKIGVTDYATLAAYVAGTGKDKNSLSGDPAFVNGVSTTIDTFNPNCWVANGTGYPGLALTDWLGSPRSPGISTGMCDMGAFEFIASVLPPTATQTGVIGAGNTTSYSVFGRTFATIVWGASGTYPGTLTTTFNSGTTPPSPPGGSRYGFGYWEFIPDVQPSGGATYSMTINFDDGQTGTVVTPGTNLILAKYNGSVWKDYQPGAGAGQSNLNYAGKTITVAGLTSFSIFALTDAIAPLPVELSAFTSTTDHRNVELNWSTVSELNNAGFDVERRIIGTDSWSKVGNVAGHGTSSVTNSYKFSERNLPTAHYNYRLKQMDNNGNFHYYDLSNEVIVGIPTKFDLSQNYPNPFNPSTKINYDLPFDSKVSIVLFDITGRKVADILNTAQTAGYQTVSFNASNLSSGTYFYQLNVSSSNGQSFNKTMKMMLVK